MVLTEFVHSLDTASYGVYVMDPQRRILFWNRGAERILGHRAEEVVGRGNAMRRCWVCRSSLARRPAGRNA